jgi:recombination protein RecR
MQIAEPLQIAIDELAKLPSVGRKTAQRLALHLLQTDEEEVKKLADAIVNLKEKLHFCKRCYNIAEGEYCEICSNDSRDQSIICVVENVSDVITIEKTNEYKGLYHVLGGVLNPLAGVTPDDLRIKELLRRLQTEEVEEIFLALNPDTEGETTALYLARLLKPIGVKITRIPTGLPVGGDLEFADEATVGRAILSRISID